jgi:hypothetical protein
MRRDDEPSSEALESSADTEESVTQRLVDTSMHDVLLVDTPQTTSPKPPPRTTLAERVLTICESFAIGEQTTMALEVVHQEWLR